MLNCVITSALLVLTVSELVQADHHHGKWQLHDHGISAWIQGEPKGSKEPTKIFFKADSSSDIVLRDLKDIAVHCEAEFPVEISFDGYGDNRISATGSESSSDMFQNETHTISVEKHSTFALIFRKTGKYSCRGQNEPHKNKSVSAFIYVPSQQLFVSPKTAMIGLTDLENSTLLIPCPITEPNATVHLVKVEEDTIIPVTPKFRYNPKQGFVHLEEIHEDLIGTYYCIASYQTLHRAVEVDVIKGAVNCSKRCGPNAICEIHHDEQICQCKDGYEETLVSQKCLKQCKSDTDCPKSMSCFPQDKSSFLHDILNLHDGRMGMPGLGIAFHHEESTTEGHDKPGECKNPCIFMPMCSFGGTDEDSLEQCQVVDHKALCFQTGGMSME